MQRLKSENLTRICWIAAGPCSMDAELVSRRQAPLSHHVEDRNVEWGFLVFGLRGHQHGESYAQTADPYRRSGPADSHPCRRAGTERSRSRLCRWLRLRL